MNTFQLQELILQALEHEKGGVEVYRTALECAVHDDLKALWQGYFEETTRHVRALEEVCAAMGLDPDRESSGRAVVRHTGKSLVEAMRLAQAGGKPAEAQLVACECVVLAETKDHQNWGLLSRCAATMIDANDPGAAALREACEAVEAQEDHHLYHSKGWCRELWVQFLGLPAVLPPPEEKLEVKTAIGAAKAEQSADKQRGLVPPTSLLQS